MVSEITNILDGIFKRTERNRPDGRPLYAYKLQRFEIDQLQAELRLELQLRPKLERQDLCGAFCLFAAEWFRRNHEEGPWSWEPIFEVGLGLSGEALRQANSPQNRGRIVELGLRWWNVPLIEIEDARRFLVTIACQGGLPLKTLKKNSGPLRRFFEEALRHHERWPTEPLDQVVQSQAEHLPTTLNNDEVIQIGVLMVAAVAKLRTDFKETWGDATDRVDYLDKQQPGWRDRLPMRIDDQEALTLITGLLSVERVAAATEQFPKIVTTLTLHYATASVSRKLQHGSSIDDDGLARFLGLEDKARLSPRYSLCLLANSKELPVAKLGRRATGSSFSINGIATSINDASALCEIRVTAAHGPERTSPVTIQGGDELGESPWVFSDDTPGVFLGQGSVKTRKDSVLVVVPLGATWDAESEESVVLLPQKIEGRQILRVRECIDIHVDDAVFRIRTRQSEDSSSSYLLTGSQVWCGRGGSLVWLGFPRIREVACDGIVRPVASQNIRWKYEGTRDWRSDVDACQGEVKVRIVRDGGAQYQTTLNIFPREFQTRILATDTSHGRILLRNLGASDVFVEADADIVTDVKSTPRESVIHVAIPGGRRPPFLGIRIVFKGYGSSTIQVPCPTSWVGIVDAAGRTLPSRLPIPLSALSGLMLRVIGPKVQVPQLVAGKQNTFLANLRHGQDDDAGIFELPLSTVVSSVAGQLSRLEEMDEAVQVGVIQVPSTEPFFKFLVSRYPGRIDRVAASEQDGEIPEFTDICLPDEVITGLGIEQGQLRLEIAPMAYPDKPFAEHACQPVGPFRWRIHHERLAPGPVLVTPWLNEYTCLRPTRISIPRIDGTASDSITTESGGIVGTGSVEEFENVVTEFNRENRRRKWQAYIKTLTGNFSAAGWNRIDAMLMASAFRPLTTFEAILALVQNPTATARVGLVKADKTWIWERMEELPFLWCLIPVSSWVRAARELRRCTAERLQAVGFPDEQINKLVIGSLAAFLDESSPRPAFLSCAATCLSVADKHLPANPMVHLLLPGSKSDLLAQRELERARLIHSHSRVDTRISWPHYDIPIASELIPQVQDLFVQESHDNQRAVLNAPVAAAAHSVFGVQVSAEQLTRFQELRGIDTTWFDRSFEIISYILAGRRLTGGQEWLLTDCEQ